MDDQEIIMPLGLMFLLNILGEWGIARGGNPYILGMLLMYISWVVVYFVMIRPKIKPKGLNTRKTKHK